MIEELLPPGVRVAEVFGDLRDVALFPQEELVIAKAVDKRRREFITVRGCARKALSSLGVAPAPIVPGPRGEPSWPDGVVGSMTHCDGYRAAAVARAQVLHGIGIDAEPHAPLPDGVLKAIALPADLAALPAGGPVHWDRLLFCAKEAVYKAWYPIGRTFLDFSDAEVVLHPDRTFTARLLVDGPTVDGRKLAGFKGRWDARDGLVVAVVTLARDSSKSRHF